MTAQDLTAYYVDLHARRPPDRVVGHVAKEIKKLLEEGFDPGNVKMALKELATGNKHPSLLPYLCSGGPQTPRYNVVAEEEAAATFLPPEENARRLEELKKKITAGGKE